MSRSAITQQLGHRRSRDQITAVFSSDLARAAETASVGFAGSVIPVPNDWRLRECDYGHRNGMPVAVLHANRPEHLDQPYPGGESWRQAIARVGRFLGDLPLRWNGQRVLVIGHVATWWGLDHFIGGISLEDLIEQDFAWQEGREYRVSRREATPAIPPPCAGFPVNDLGGIRGAGGRLSDLSNVPPACSDSIAGSRDGADHSAHIPDHGHPR